MGKEKENREQHRIDYKKSISGKRVERLIITSKKVKVLVQPIQSNRIRMWLQGEASEVTLRSKKREKELVVMLQEGSDVRNVELKIAIPTTIKYLSIGTSSADVKIKNVLPEELRIKTNNGLVDISTPGVDSESDIKINTQHADIRAQIKGHIELDSKSTTGETHDYHKTNGKATIKVKAHTISGDITVL